MNDATAVQKVDMAQVATGKKLLTTKRDVFFSPFCSFIQLVANEDLKWLTWLLLC